MPVPEKRPGVTINRRDLISVPVPVANLLWRSLHVREGVPGQGRVRTRNVLVEIEVEGIHQGKPWQCGLEFDYANVESFYCRPKSVGGGQRMEVPDHLSTDGVLLDLSASGRGQQQTLLLLAHMAANPGSVLLLDEPDAHLEILRQRQIYEVLSQTAHETGSQIIAASHSEVLLNEAAGRDVVVAFVGRPHRIDDRGTQVLKALKDISFEESYLAEKEGWVLYLEGSTDLKVLQSFAKALDHPAPGYLERPFVKYVGDQPRKAQEHFRGLREAKPDLVGLGIFDRLDRTLPSDVDLELRMWKKREVENYLCHREILLRFAEEQGRALQGELSGLVWRDAMDRVLEELERALRVIGEDPWGDDIKASEHFLKGLFRNFYASLELPNLMSKSNFHVLADYVAPGLVDPEVRDMLDAVYRVARKVQRGGGAS